MPEPSASQIRIRVQASGIGPTDLKIRRGDVQAVFPLPEPAVLGFETAGTVDAVGSDVSDVAVGDEVAALLPGLGGYGEYALAAAWTRKPSHVTWSDAAAMPSAAETAVGALRQLGVAAGETVLILGGTGSVGIVATQLAKRQGLNVIAAVGERDVSLATELGATPARLWQRPAVRRPQGRRPRRRDLRRSRQRGPRRRHHAHRRHRARHHHRRRAGARARGPVLGRDARPRTRRCRHRDAAPRLR